MTEEQFEKLLQNPESSILDFKSNMYDFTDDIDNKTTAKFVKDVISFCNTIRTESSYVIFGVKENGDGSKTFLGIEKFVDDSILQQKVTSKVFPVPRFQYETLMHKGQMFGIIEFPVTKYISPITSIVKLKGVAVGQAYYRQGTSNTEASALEVIRIIDWLRSLPEDQLTSSSSNVEISKLILDLTTSKKNLSTIMAEILAVSKKYSLNTLINFAVQELQGVYNLNNDPGKDKFNYRIQNIYMTANTFEMQISNWTAAKLQSTLDNDSRFFKNKCLFNQPLIKIEEWLDKFKGNKNLLIRQQFKASEIFDDVEGELRAIFFENNIVDVYNGIRQKTLDTLMII